MNIKANSVSEYVDFSIIKPGEVITFVSTKDHNELYMRTAPRVADESNLVNLATGLRYTISTTTKVIRVPTAEVIY